MYNITFQQIEAFLTVAKSFNLSKAGEILYTSQPALSKTLKRFEEGVGMKLFTRSNRGMALTNDGEYLLSVLEPLYKTIVQSIQYAQSNSMMPVKVLRIIEPSSYYCAEDFDMLKDTVRRYAAKYPEVRIQEILCDFKELRQTLDFGNADIAFTEDFCVRDMLNISVKRLSKMNMYIVISAKHPLAQSNELDYEALSNLTVFSIPTLPDEQLDTEAQLTSCQQIGFTPKNIELMPNFLSFMHAIDIGNGIGICSKLRKLGAENELRFYPVRLSITPQTCVAWRTGRLSREVKNLIDMLPEDENRVVREPTRHPDADDLPPPVGFQAEDL